MRFRGWRPGAFGDIWDRMSPAERRWALWSDVVIGIFGALLVYLVVRYFE